MKSLTQDQVLESLCIHYHDDFKNETLKILRPKEYFLAVGNWSIIPKRRGSVSATLKYIGYYLITNYRDMKISFEAEAGLFSKKREKIKISSWEDAFELPTFPLTQNEIKSRQLTEYPLKEINNVSREEVTKKSKTLLKIIKSDGYFGMYFNDLDEGNNIYGTLVDIIHGDLEQNRPIPNLVEQLEKLTELHRYQVITDEEFEAAKKRLGM